MQHAMSVRGLAAENRLDLRIGVHVGDVIIEGDDIFGDGVNIAARLEALAEPGGICVSARVYEDAAGKVEAGFEDIGEQALKNIDRPVRVYKVRDEAPTTAEQPSEKPAATSSLRKIGFLAVAPRPIFDEFKRALAAYGYIDGQIGRAHV